MGRSRTSSIPVMHDADGAASLDDAIEFAENLLTVLDEGSKTTTYKYLTLLALIDCAVGYAGPDGLAPTSITTRQLAERALELTWPQASEFVRGSGGRVLRQTASGQQAEIITRIMEVRSKLSVGQAATIAEARRIEPELVDRLVQEIEWKLVEMPLPRLQRVGQSDLEFIYSISWDDKISQGSFHSADFDNRIFLTQSAGSNLIRLTGLLRPLIQRQWAAMVARLNQDIVEDSQLEVFLFGASRVDLSPIRDPLRDLQSNRCFYCEMPIRSTDAEVDHFVPWSRYPNNEIGNFVVADKRCNGSKRDFLAAAEHVERWCARTFASQDALELSSIAADARWEDDREKSLGIARGIYLHLPREAQLWEAAEGRKRSFVAADISVLRRVLAVSNECEPVPFEVYEPGVYLHGTKSNLAVGDLLVPGRESNFEDGRPMNYVYFTATLDAATWGAELASGDGRGRIYIVEPTGDFEDDPNVTNKRFSGNPTRSFRTREPLRVVGEIVEWIGHSPERLQEMHDAIKRVGPGQIED